MKKNQDSTEYPLALYLTQIRNRLERDVAPYFRLIHLHADRTMLEGGFPEIIGNWATIRMILPPIYAVAKAQPGMSLADAEANEAELVCDQLSRLNIPVPHIFLEMYRHSLMHSDTPRGVKLGTIRASWSISIGVGRHFAKGGVIHIDTEKLYEELVEYLDAEIISAEANKSMIAMPGDVDLTGSKSPTIASEFEQLT